MERAELSRLSDAPSGPIPVLRPSLAPAAEILPYLQAIDKKRWYSNYGPLVKRLEAQISHHLGYSDPVVISTSNATVGITATLLALEAPAGSVCIMPSWTFAATPHAARAAGMTPWFHDVNPRTWALDPDEVAKTITHLSCRVGAALVVSPFGAPIDVDAWESFEERTGVRVVADAAAGFDTARACKIPFVVSLHATKVLGAGEGGFIATTDEKLHQRIMACCNFGFSGSRSAIVPAINGKLSEYHAAVALANLDRWPATRLRHVRIIEWYRRALGKLGGVGLHPGYGDGWVTGTTSVVLPQHSADHIASQLRQRGIETRQWWGQGCHVQPAFADCPRGPLPVTEDLGGRVLGLPHVVDMERKDVDTVASVLTEALASLTAPALEALLRAVNTHGGSHIEVGEPSSRA